MTARIAGKTLPLTLTMAVDRRFDILQARQVHGGKTIRVYFDITELMAQEESILRARSALSP